MTVDHERQLWDAYKHHGDMQAREELILEYVPFTTSVVKQCHATAACDSFDDALSEAYLALVQCVDRFDPERGSKFTTLAGKRIRGAIMDFARKAFGMFSPRNRKEIPIPFSEIEAENPRGEHELHDVVLAGTGNPPLDNVLKEDDAKDWGRLLRQLPLNWRLVLMLRVFEGVAHSDIAQAFGFSTDRSAQIVTKIRKRLHSYKEERSWPWRTPN